jgi:hypothetical protein
MPENQEMIEAKLCDYIEGELDAAGKAEIEQHLQSHPEHRELIAHLMQQRTLLRGLPRDAAPSDIADMLNGQLEREALLGQPIEYDKPIATIGARRWPGLSAVAAILLLTAGLAAVVYYVLPSSKPPAEFATSAGRVESPAPTTLETDRISRIAAAAPATTQPVTEGALAMRDSSVRETAARLSSPKSSDVAKPSEASTVAPSSLATNAGASAPSDVFANSVSAAVNQNAETGNDKLFAQAVKDQLRQQGVADNAMLVMVDTDNTAAANADVQRYLSDNHISYEPMPQPLSSAKAQTFLMSRQRQTLGQIDIANLQLPAIPARGGASPSPSKTVVASPTTAPTGAAPEQDRVDAAMTQQSVRAENMLLLRNITRQQAQQLSDAIVTQNAAPAQTEPRESSQLALAKNPTRNKVQVVQLPPTTQPARDESLIQPGETLTLMVPDGLMPLEQHKLELRVPEQGELEIPNIGSVEVVGKKPAEVEQLILDKFRLQKFAPEAKVSIERNNSSTTEPSTQPVIEGLAKSEPSTQPSNERLDVVIVVRNDIDVAAPTTAPAAVDAPATQPATQPTEPVVPAPQ